MSEERLFGQSYDDELYTSAASWYEAKVEPFVPYPEGAEIEFAEWTAEPLSRQLPKARELVGDMLDRYFAYEATDSGYDQVADAGESPGVLALFQTALDEWAKGITYLMADKFVATHHLSFDAEGQPLVDGEPLYRKVEA